MNESVEVALKWANNPGVNGLRDGLQKVLADEVIRLREALKPDVRTVLSFEAGVDEGRRQLTATVAAQLERMLAMDKRLAAAERVLTIARKFVPDPTTIQWERREIELRVAFAAWDATK